MSRFMLALLVSMPLIAIHADTAHAKKCYAWGADGHRKKIACPGQAQFDAEAKAMEKAKANQAPEPTNQRCDLKNGKLICQPAQ